MPQSDFIARLSTRRPGLDALEPAWRMIDDVLAGRIKRRSADGWLSPYFPKGRLEPQGEYSLRVELTPFFPETPQLLASRLGALFKTRPQIELFPGDERSAWRARTENFLAHAGRQHASFEDIAVQAACLAQSHGFCAALLDRDPLPDDLKRRDVSQAEASARQLGRPYLALYAAPDILDWDFGSDGRLAWVKFCEQEMSRAFWDADPQPVRTFRIVDRSFIHVYRVRKDTSGEWQTTAEPPIAHGFAEVPVAFLHPFPAQDGIGRPILQRAAEADVAAARVLSDLVWDLFLLGNPILTLKTNRTEDDLRRLQLGASRYIPLRNGQPGIDNPEALEFVQLDPTGIELLFRAHSLFAAQALKSANSGDEAALPREQSGVAQAWRFKTGEERVLFMLARALEPFLAQCVKLGVEALAHDGTSAVPHEELSRALTEISVRLPESFDVTSTAETLANLEKILELATKLGQTELAKSALQRLESLLGTLPAERREALAAERAALHLQS
ncbi:MAG TPA: hypothetical protein VEJ63_08880 [Planctomycetota bacterium]|nr:hypothetical protein [Planctomycetota bacterium]